MQQPDLIPRRVLFGNPSRIRPTISPDGRRLAYLAPVDGVLNVWLGTLGGDDFRPVTHDRDRGIRAYFWAHDDRNLLYLQDRVGEEQWHVYAIDTVDGGTRDLTPFDKVQARVIALDQHAPDTLLVTLNRRRPELQDVYELSLSSGELTQVVENPGYSGWLPDRRMQVRCAFEPTPDGGTTLLVREAAPAPWEPVCRIGYEDTLTTRPVGFSADGESLLMVSSLGAETGRLVWLRLRTGEVDVLYEDPRHDVVNVDVHPDTYEPQLVTVLRERIDLVPLDPGVAEDLDRLRALHRGELKLTGRDHADRTWLVSYSPDDGPIAYYAYDRVTGAGTHLFTHRPELESHALARMESFTFAARDGLELHGYLSFPAGAGRSGLPAVLSVHGGPWERDTWGFSPSAQWLANRGYLVIHVNFRGSTGYGKSFVNAGDREWGGKMHDDLVDTVRWVVDRGYADPARIAIYGASYGGYAALVGAAFTPDVFRCAVDLVGASNLNTMIRSVPPWWKPVIAQFHKRIGNPETEEEFLWSRSPLSRADRIRIPLLIAQGANDPRVPQAEAEQIVSALRANGIPHEYLLFPDEGHGFAKPANRIKFYTAAEQFLARYLGGRYEE